MDQRLNVSLKYTLCSVYQSSMKFHEDRVKLFSFPGSKNIEFFPTQKDKDNAI